MIEEQSVGCGVWGVGCGEVGRINKNNLLTPISSNPESYLQQSYLLTPEIQSPDS
ncbi:MAG: hypothetical protein ACKPA9_04715 [Microcystis sp.]